MTWLLRLRVWLPPSTGRFACLSFRRCLLLLLLRLLIHLFNLLQAGQVLLRNILLRLILRLLDLLCHLLLGGRPLVVGFLTILDLGCWLRPLVGFGFGFGHVLFYGFGTMFLNQSKYC